LTQKAHENNPIIQEDIGTKWNFATYEQCMEHHKLQTDRRQSAQKWFMPILDGRIWILLENRSLFRGNRLI